MAANTLSITFARNTRSGLYEVHLADCHHLVGRHMEPMSTIEVDDAKDAPSMAAERFEAENDGCLTKLGPCVRG